MALNQPGIKGYSEGFIADQTLLLQEIRDGLGVYNTAQDPMIARFCEPTVRQILRVSQAPKVFGPAADGGNPESQKMLYRLIDVPLKPYDLSSEFTTLWLQDALPSDVMNEVNGAMAGDVELMNSLFYQAIFTKRTAGSVGTAYTASFYNGETDVPAYKNNSFSSAHFHYLGLNTVTLALDHTRSMRKDIQEHGYGLLPGSLHLLISSTEVPAVAALFNSNTTLLQANTPERIKAIDQGIVGTGTVLEGMIIHVDDNVPAGYIALIASDVRPLAQRKHPNPAYQGLMTFRDNVNEEYPLAGMKFLRRTGFCVQHLAAGTCRQLVASTTYTNPTFRLTN